MRIRTVLALVLALFAVPATAKLGTIDQVPAATLLYPYFEVDTTSPQGVNTVLTLQNTSASAGLVNVTLWTDYGLPTMHFLVYLTGFDAETFNMRDLLNRSVPLTADAGDDPQDQISPKGPISQDINFPGTTGFREFGGAFSHNIIAAHTGQASIDYFGGMCGARNFGDGIARGYVTIDDVNGQIDSTPADPNYVVDAGLLGARNIYAGSYVVLDPAHGRVYADGAVPVEASYADPLVTTPGNITFYGRFHGMNAGDKREPLPTAWAGRFATDRTDMDSWRDPGVPLAPFACGGAPAGLPSGQHFVTGYAADGSVTGSPVGNLFPFVEGKTAGSALGLVQSVGWLFVNLNQSAGVIRQSWLSFRQIPSAAPTNGRMGYSVPGIQLGNAAYGDDPTNP